MLDTLPIYERLKSLLNKERLLHTIGTLHTACLLAEVHQFHHWQELTAAALLHDAARCLDEKQLNEYINIYQLSLDETDKGFPQLWHALVGAEMAEHEFGIKSQAVKRAIMIHPTGDANMSLLDQIIFLADYIEPTREFETQKEIKQIAFADLNSAVCKVLKTKVNYIESQGKPVHPRAIRAINYFEKMLKRPAENL